MSSAVSELSPPNPPTGPPKLPIPSPGIPPMLGIPFPAIFGDLAFSTSFLGKIPSLTILSLREGLTFCLKTSIAPSPTNVGNDNSPFDTGIQPFLLCLV